MLSRYGCTFDLDDPQFLEATLLVTLRAADRVGSLGARPDRAVFIQRRGQRAAVVVSPERYDLMLEDTEDAAAVDEVIAEERPSIPWAQVKADLGWT